MFDAWDVWGGSDAGAELRPQAKAAYEALLEQHAELFEEHERRFNDRFPPDMPDMQTMFAAMYAGQGRYISFLVGKYDRTDHFDLVEGALQERRVLGRLMCWDSAETLAALRVLDEAVRTDATTMFMSGYLWSNISNKRDYPADDVEHFAVPLYERRLVEQERILKGELKRGHKAFRFYPLEGGG